MYLLAQLTPLFFFSLNNCGLGDDGASAFARVLKTNRNLKILRLSKNGITMNGLTELAAVIRSQSTLQRLSLDYNLFRSAVVMANALVANVALKELSIMRDDYDLETYRAFENLGLTNHTLTELQLEYVFRICFLFTNESLLF